MELEPDYNFELESKNFNLDKIFEFAVNWALNSISPIMESIILTPPSIEPFPSIELKVLPTHLKYIYLGKQETFPVIIASNLTCEKEENLKTILKRHKKAIGWTMTDIKGLSPAILQYRIHINEEATPKRDMQLRLNLIMQEAVHAEIVKLLDNG